MTEIEKVTNRLNKAQELVAKLEKQYEELRLKELQKVKMTKQGEQGETFILTFGDRVLKAKRHPRYNHRFNVFEGGRKIISEYMFGIHNLRFAIACGTI